MTKKSQSRINKDIAAGKRRAQAGSISMPAVSQNAMKPTQNGGYKLSPVDRILSDCAMGLGLVPPATPTNTCWDDLTAVYRQCSEMLFQHTLVTEVLNDKELMAFVDDAVTFNANVQQFAADLTQMNKELHQLRALHADKTGGSEDGQVVLHSFAIYEQYKLWMTKHDGVVKPTIMHILEQTNTAELKRQAAMHAALQGQLSAEVPQENLDAGVVNVGYSQVLSNYEVSDVEFKEAPIQHSDLSTADAEQIVTTAMRGQQRSIYQIDEAGFMPLDATAPKHAQA